MGPMLNRPTSTRRRLPQLAAAALAVAALGAGAPAAYAAPSYCGADEAAPDTPPTAAWEGEHAERVKHDPPRPRAAGAASERPPANGRDGPRARHAAPPLLRA